MYSISDSSFEKIDLTDNNQQGTSDNSMPKKREQKQKKTRNIIFFVLAVILLIVGYTAFKARGIYAKSQASYKQALIAYDTAKKQNVVVFKEELLKTQKEIGELKKEVKGVSYLAFIPLASWYYNDAVHGIEASSHGISALISVADSLIPYADVLGLKGEKSFVSGSAQDRIQIAVKTMGKVVPNIDEIEKDLRNARDEIDKINPNHYPNILAIGKARTRLEQLRSVTDEAVSTIEQAKPLIKVLPELLGEPTSKKYIVLFQNDKELRPTGGFLTYYAIFKVEHGLVKVERSSDVYTLDTSIRSHPAAPYIIRNYLPKESVLYVRNSNLSPDFIESMKAFRSLFEKSSSYEKVDGIIALDTHVLVHILDILGEVQAAGIKFNSKTDPRCDCPQVVYELEANISTPVGFVRESRKALIGELLYGIMEKALSSSPKLYWGRLFQQGFLDIHEKHILFSLNDPEAQKGMEALNWAGKIKEFKGDYLHINDANFGGQKSNMYVKQSVKVEYDLTQERVVTKTVTISYANPKPHSDCNLERGGLCLNATLRDFLRVYVPSDSRLVKSKGSQVKVETKNDLGKSVFEGFITVDPLTKSQIIFTYELPFKLENGSPLPLLIQKQPGTDKIPYEIYVKGKKVKSFDLTQDTQLNLTSF